MLIIKPHTYIHKHITEKSLGEHTEMINDSLCVQWDFIFLYKQIF